MNFNFNLKLFSLIFSFILISNLNYLFAYYCAGKYPKNSTDCTSLSTFAYQCCYMEGSNVATSVLRYQMCYGFLSGKDPSEQSTPKYSPSIKIDVLECGTPQPYAINKIDLCGIDSPENSTICGSYGSNCCYLKYLGDSFCLDKNTFNALANRVVLECSVRWNNVTMIYLFFIILILFN